MSYVSVGDTKGLARRQITIGAFVLGGVVLALVAVVLFGKAHLFSPTIRAAIVFQDSVSGLAVGAPVNFRGMQIGAVASIAVEFDPGSTAILHPTITDLPEIPTRPSTIQRVKDELSQLPLRELAENANATVQSLRSLSDKLDRSVPPLIDSLRTTSDQTAAAVTLASQAVIALQQRADTTLGDLSRLADVGTSMLNARGADVRSLLVTSNQTVAQARDLLKDLKGLTAERGVDRANVDSALRDLATAAAALRGLASDVEHNPQLLLTGRRP